MDKFLQANLACHGVARLNFWVLAQELGVHAVVHDIGEFIRVRLDLQAGVVARLQIDNLGDEVGDRADILNIGVARDKAVGLVLLAPE